MAKLNEFLDDIESNVHTFFIVQMSCFTFCAIALCLAFTLTFWGSVRDHAFAVCIAIVFTILSFVIILQYLIVRFEALYKNYDFTEVVYNKKRCSLGVFLVFSCLVNMIFTAIVIWGVIENYRFAIAVVYIIGLILFFVCFVYMYQLGKIILERHDQRLYEHQIELKQNKEKLRQEKRKTYIQQKQQDNNDNEDGEYSTSCKNAFKGKSKTNSSSIKSEALHQIIYDDLNKV